MEPSERIDFDALYNHQFLKSEVSPHADAQDDCFENHKLVGVAFNHVLLPPLRSFIDDKLGAFHRDLKAQKSSFGFNASKEKGWYQKPNPPANRHDLAKKYMREYMVHFQCITDDEFDGSAATAVLRNSSCFSKEIKNAITDILNKVRNKLAHCNYFEWDLTKFLESFALFENLLPHLEGNPRVNVTYVREELNRLKKEGLKKADASVTATIQEPHVQPQPEPDVGTSKTKKNELKGT